MTVSTDAGAQLAFLTPSVVAMVGPEDSDVEDLEADHDNQIAADDIEDCQQVIEKPHGGRPSPSSG